MVVYDAARLPAVTVFTEYEDIKDVLNPTAASPPVALPVTNCSSGSRISAVGVVDESGKRNVSDEPE